MKNILDNQRESIIEEIEKTNLRDDLDRICNAIALTNISSRNQDFIIEVCCGLHQVYDDFHQILISAIIKQYKAPSNLQGHREFNRKRYILRLLTELYLKGLF